MFVSLPGEPLLLLPYFQLPLLSVGLHISPKLPGNRNPLLHHVFPVLQAPPPPEAMQTPLDIYSIMKSDALAVAIDIALASGGKVSGDIASQLSCRLAWKTPKSAATSGCWIHLILCVRA